MAARKTTSRLPIRPVVRTWIWVSAAMLLSSLAGPAAAQNEGVIGSVAIQTTQGTFFITLEEDNNRVRDYARAFASLVEDRTFFHQSDKRIGCDAEDENCFLCECDYSNATTNCLGEQVGECVLDSNMRSCTNPPSQPEFRVNDQTVLSAVVYAGLFEIDASNNLLATANSLAPLDLSVAGVFENNAFTVALVRDASGDLTPEWIVNLEDNSDLFDDEDNGGAAAHFVIGQVSSGEDVVRALAGLTTTDARCNESLIPETDAAIRAELEQIPVVDPTIDDDDDGEPDLIEFCNPSDIGYPDCLQPDCLTLAATQLSCEDPLCYSVSELPEEEQTDEITHFCDFPQQPNFPLITSAEPSGLSLVNNGLAPPEPENLVDYPNNPQLTVDVRNLRCFDTGDPPGPCSNPGVRTLLEVTTSGSVELLRVSDTSRAELTSRNSVTGGTVEVLELYNRAQGTIENGTLAAVATMDESDLALRGGTVDSWSASLSSTGLVTGGDLVDVDALDGSLIRIVGDLFTVDGQGVPFGPLSDTSGELGGTLASGETLLATFQQGSATESGTIHLLSSNDMQARKDFRTIGDPANAADPATGLGAVAYLYSIQQTEVSNTEYAEFLSGSALTDPHDLYDSRMGSDPRGGILRTGADGNFRYETISGRANLPVVFVSLFDAMRYANWLHNGRPSGTGDAGTEDGSYQFVDGVLQGGRQPKATFAVPTRDEWYKAAYYDPATKSYFAFPTASDTEPASQLPTRDLGNGANAGDALQDDSEPLTEAGAYAFSASSYGTLDQAGNVLEWNEDSLDLMGGHWGTPASSTDRQATPVSIAGQGDQENFLGFRIPEPSASLLAMAAMATLASLRGRRRSAR